MIGVEIDFVVPDSLKSLELYEKIFDLKRIEVTDFPKGLNEVIFSLYDVKFHMLDENPELMLVAPKAGDPKPMWFNVMVPDIKATYQKAVGSGCEEIQPIAKLEDFGVSNGIFSDPYGYIWMLHEVHREVSFEDRKKIFEEQMRKMTFASVYPHYVTKIEKKGRTVEELHRVIHWLTDYDVQDINKLIEENVTFEEFFQRATLNTNAPMIRGVICGYRIEEIENPITRQVRYLDKLVDELAKGKAMEKILRG